MLRIVFLAFLALANAATLGGHSGAEVRVLHEDHDISPDGNYHWGYELDNGVKVEEQGSVKALGPEDTEVSAHGSYAFVSPEGESVQMTYVADSNGFQPQGSHIPVAPPVPEAILRALDWIAAHPEQS